MRSVTVENPSRWKTEFKGEVTNVTVKNPSRWKTVFKGEVTNVIFLVNSDFKELS